VEFVEDRPGHDRRYGIDDLKFRKETGWSPKVSLREGLRSTVEWYNKNVDWLEEVERGDYRSYYEKVYGRE
jgi:dTDP-glucose 4,6-dehydratase